MIVTMYYDEHGPAHFHVRYGSHKASIAIESGSLFEGELPPRALGLIVEWAALHRTELLEDWERARSLQPLSPVAPLE
jgi:hypothetical protein